MAQLFVYGTLLNALNHPKHHYLTDYCDFICPGKLQGRLYDLGGYPGARLSDQATEWVFGELYHIRQESPLIQALDKYEGCSEHYPHPQEYQRTAATIVLNNGITQPAWVYLYTLNTDHLRPILTGDYAAYLKTGLK